MAVIVVNRQRRVRVDVNFLRRSARAALPLCLRQSGPGPAALPALDEVEVTILSDPAIAKINTRFLGHEGPTDVITFDHGEILVSAETARKNAGRYASSVDEELALYIVHGLLHLNGWSDKTPREAAAMRTAQEQILREALISDSLR